MNTNPIVKPIIFIVIITLLQHIRYKNNRNA